MSLFYLLDGAVKNVEHLLIFFYSLWSNSKQYAREARNDFSSTATTEKGELVVASKKGDIRLFSHINKNAKTHLPGFGGKQSNSLAGPFSFFLISSFPVISPTPHRPYHWCGCDSRWQVDPCHVQDLPDCDQH